ncbi:cell division protein FtsZ [Notoacmeibacter sp. MSK16QG-6]|uniref:cell division protein FtsZ n=1 Tax=Notoacmeibacter sp. MSK16QG-6 TaxID=2957982 RepID=UPI0020A0D0A7|nr:cell division protein FtsZ [Notoacmeibacter sp. MSK16QG-6]MCP1199696.1 cell division protein FtsZ [Notoacmeibacter sp. MSK16QG-6]
MSINLQKPDITELKPRITVFGVGGGGGNAVNNMISAGLEGVDFVVANTDAQALAMSKSDRIIQLGAHVTEGLGAGSQPEVGRAAAEECIDEIVDHLSSTHMCFVTAGMGGGTGTGAAPVVANAAREKGILTVGVVTKPFDFEGKRRMRIADQGIEDLHKAVDTLIVIPNQNLFRIANDKTTFADAFGMADQVLFSGVACITDLMVKEGLINLDFADVRSVMREMGKAMMGTGEASGEGRAMAAAEAAIANPLLDESSMKGAEGLLISITGGRDLTLYEVDEAATRIREEVDPDANIILGATFDESLEGIIRVSVVATGIDRNASSLEQPVLESRPVSARPAAPAQPARPAPAERPVEMTAPAVAASPAPQPRPAAVEPAARPTSQIFGAMPQTAPAPAAPKPAPAAPRRDPEAQAVMPTQSAPVRQQALPLEEPAMAQPHTDPRAASKPAPTPRSEPVDEMPRMPSVEDFPPQLRAEIAHRHETRSDEAERGPLGLIKKLTTGLGRREDEAGRPSESSSASAAPRAPKLRPAAPAAPAADRRPVAQDSSVYAPRRGQTDQVGRLNPAVRSEEEALEIPAFLRRQAN